MPQTVDRKQEAEQQYRDAEHRAYEYSRTVLDPRIKALEADLMPRLDREIQFSATLDGRFNTLHPKTPFPEVSERTYKVRATWCGGGDTKTHYISVQYWHNDYRSGSRGEWSGAECSHKLAVLEHLAKQERAYSPGVWPDALMILIGTLSKLGNEGKLTTTEMQALSLVQHQHRDQAMLRDRF